MRVRKRYDFSLGEELGMAIVLLATIVIYRGLYDAVPFLMSIGLGVIAAYLCVVAVRMRRRSVVDLYRWRLRSVDRVLPEGRVFVGMMLVFSLLTLHSATIRYHEIRGARFFELARQGASEGVRATSDLAFADRYGLFTSASTDSMLASLHARDGRWGEALPHLARLVERAPDDAVVRGRLATAFRHERRLLEALQHYRIALELEPGNATTHYEAAGVFFQSGDRDQALAHLRSAVAIDPDFGMAHYDLGGLFLGEGDLTKAILHLRGALDAEPDFADAHYNLAVALLMSGELEAAASEIERAWELNPGDGRTSALRQQLMDQGANGLRPILDSGDVAERR
jgi:tetratricopeptide (TPR) repeat protein